MQIRIYVHTVRRCADRVARVGSRVDLLQMAKYGSLGESAAAAVLCEDSLGGRSWTGRRSHCTVINEGAAEPASEFMYVGATCMPL